MFKCWDCGRTFSEPDTWRENHGEVLSGCPSCGGSFDEAKKCDYCGEYFLESQRRDTCQECIDELKEKHRKVLSDNFTELELDILSLVL